MDINELIEAKRYAGRTIMRKAASEGREFLTVEEDEVCANLDRQISTLEKMIADEAAIDRRAEQTHETDAARREQGADRAVDLADGQPGATRPDTTGWRYSSTGELAGVDRGESYASHPAVQAEIARHSERDKLITGMHGSLGQQIRALTTTGASAVVPTSWSAELIDLARNQSAIMRAGAVTVPMPTKVVEVGRLTADPTTNWHGEGASDISASDPSFDNVTLTAKTLTALVVGSLEWFQDAANAGSVVENALAKAMALQLDLIGLYGGNDGSTYGTQGVDLSSALIPKGILVNTATNAAANLLGNATDGTTLTAATPFNELLDAVYAPQLVNEQPNAYLVNPLFAKQLAQTYDANYQPLRLPADLASMTRYVTNQVATYDQGTGHDQSDVFVGDFSKLLVGVRQEVSLKVLDQRYAEVGNIAVLATWRGDFAVARDGAFSVYVALGGT
jgi:HK97 family phage major capsid protein